MFFKPAILSLFLGSLLISGMLLYAAYFGVQILRNWDLKSGSETQLTLERRTYLVSTILVYVFAFQLISLILFVATADRLHPFFTGAMCAAGSLNANPWGYPAAIFKVVNFLLAGSWLVVNYVDNQGYDYPLIKKKYLLLLAIAPLILAETVVQGKYFLGLTPEVITSCCGSMFASEGKGVAAGVAALPMKPLQAALAAAMGGTFLLGVRFYRKGRGGYGFAGVSLLTFLISMASLISFISLYIYELPTHHCPFCILQGEYRYIGYPLHLSLLVGALAGLGVGILMPFRHIPSLQTALPMVQKRLVLLTLGPYAFFAAIGVYYLIFSNLKM
ncbi:MAG: hypothetical protein FJ134_08335 [Deltaproteobacteria bacterium]|nr:hypothetical protein [Deltaproteobacteria bacterium]